MQLSKRKIASQRFNRLGGGKPSSAHVGTIVYTSIYAVFTLTGFFRGSAMNAIGLKVDDDGRSFERDFAKQTAEPRSLELRHFLSS